MDGEIRTHSRASVRWTLAVTSANTGDYLYFLSLRAKENAKSNPPSTPKIAVLRQKIGDFYFFTITYSLFTKSYPAIFGK